MPAGLGARPLSHAQARGWFLAREVGWLAGVSGERIGQWARYGYIRSSRSDGPPRVYSFQDVGEAMVVHELLDLGVPAKDIRRSVENLRSLYGAWPLTTAPLRVTEMHTGRTRGGELLILAREEDELVNIAKGEGKESLLPVSWHLRYLRTLLRNGGWVIKDHPEIKSIEVDPDRLGGTPTIRDRRVPAEKVALLAGTQGGMQTLREDYELSEAEIDDAVRWHRAVIEQAAA